METEIYEMTLLLCADICPKSVFVTYFLPWPRLWRCPIIK